MMDLHHRALSMSQVCLLLHQPALFFRLGGIRTHDGNIESVVSYRLTINPSSPVQVLPLLPLITKQLHYFYANQTNCLDMLIFSHLLISTLFLKYSKSFK